MTIKINGDNTVANPGFSGDDTDTGLQVGTNEVKLVTDGSARATVDSSGRLLVGPTTARSNILDGDGGNTLTPHLQIETANDDSAKALSIIFGRNNSNGAEIVLGKHRNASVGGTTIVNDGDQLGSLTFSGSDGTNFRPAATIEASVDATPGSSDMPGRLVFSTSADGAAVPTERLRITSDGTIKLASGSPGIDFSQIQTNASGMTTETLDSYEEGSWTPTVTVEGQSAATTDKQNGRYIKIGSKVTVWAYVQLNGTPTGRGVNNAWQHGGLPFPKRNDEGGFDVGGPIMYWTIDDADALNGTRPYMLVARLFNNSSGGRIRGHDSSDTQAGQNLSLLLKDNTEYAYSFTYETTA